MTTAERRLFRLLHDRWRLCHPGICTCHEAVEEIVQILVEDGGVA